MNLTEAIEKVLSLHKEQEFLIQCLLKHPETVSFLGSGRNLWLSDYTLFMTIAQDRGLIIDHRPDPNISWVSTTIDFGPGLNLNLCIDRSTYERGLAGKEPIPEPPFEEAVDAKVTSTNSDNLPF